MELEPLFEGRFVFSHEQPNDHFAAYAEDGDVVGYISGDGEIEGQRLGGALSWVNTPRRRNDGTWLYDFTGLIRTDDGVHVRFETGGYNWSMTDDPFDYTRRQIVGAITFQTAGEKYRWLNATYAVLEAVEDPEAFPNVWQATAFAVRPTSVARKE